MLVATLKIWGTCKVRNEIETKRNEMNFFQNEM
jgi:hypothetical protein